MKKRCILLLKWVILLFLKNGGGKHFHFICLIKYYQSKDYTQEKITELIQDADRRHETQVSKKIKKGTLTKQKFNIRRTTKKDRDDLINYFYGHYGLQRVSKRLNTIIDKLNAGEDYDGFKDVKIPYAQLKDMFIYYSKDLDKIYAQKMKKVGFINPAQRISFDLTIVVNNLEDYINRREVVYNELNNVSVEKDGTPLDLSLYLDFKQHVDNNETFELTDRMHKYADELGKIE